MFYFPFHICHMSYMTSHWLIFFRGVGQPPGRYFTNWVHQQSMEFTRHGTPSQRKAGCESLVDAGWCWVYHSRALKTSNLKQKMMDIYRNPKMMDVDGARTMCTVLLTLCLFLHSFLQLPSVFFFLSSTWKQGDSARNGEFNEKYWVGLGLY